MQNAYSVVNRAQEDELELCEERELAFVPFFPLGSAFTGGPKQLAADPVIAEVAARRRTSSIQHLEENIAAGDIELDEQDMQRLEAVTPLGDPMAAVEH